MYLAKKGYSLQHTGFTPIYKKLTDYYRERIIKQEMPPTSRMDSINKMMERHHISRETAKLILKKLVEQGLVESRIGKGSFVTANVSIKKEWGIVIPFYSTNLETLIGLINEEAKMRGRGISYFLDYNDPEEETRLVGSMIRKGFEAIIIVPNYNESLTASFYRNLKPGNTRIVLIDNTMAGSYFNYVIQSYDLGVKRAFDYLISRGYKNLLFVKNEAWRRTNLVYQLMENTLGILTHQYSPTMNLFIISDLNEFNKDYVMDKRIGGILSCSDTSALRIVGRLRKWNIKLPEEISVVAYGNTELTSLFKPAVTAIDCKYREMARIAASLISDENKKSSPEQHVIQPALIIRET